MSLALLLGACSNAPPTVEEVEGQAFNDLREEIRLVIDEPDRQATVLGIVDELMVDFVELRRLAEARRMELHELNANYDATREQFTNLLARFAEQRSRSHQQFVETRRSLRSATTPDEWAELQKTNSKSMATLARLIAEI
jgi:Glu-tRNA(Gln) amidotransferase subunit E-like FAD-binding protein